VSSPHMCSRVVLHQPRECVSLASPHASPLLLLRHDVILASSCLPWFVLCVYDCCLRAPRESNHWRSMRDSHTTHTHTHSARASFVARCELMITQYTTPFGSECVYVDTEYLIATATTILRRVDCHSSLFDPLTQSAYKSHQKLVHACSPTLPFASSTTR
jgi:hypothetical protein